MRMTLPGDIGVPTDSLSSVGQKTGPGGSSPPTLAIGCEAHADERASHKRKVVSSNLTAATRSYGRVAAGMVCSRRLISASP